MKEMAREIDGEAKRNVLMKKKMKTAASILRTKTNARSPAKSQSSPSAKYRM